MISIKPLFDQLFLLAAKKRQSIIRLFQCCYAVLLIFYFIGGRSIFLQDAQFFRFFRLGNTAGEVAIGLFVLVSIPGIARRFKHKHPLLMILMMFRRYIGILLFQFVFIHVSFVRVIPLLSGESLLPFPLFQLFGLMAEIILFLLFLTSNDWSVKHLGIWWTRLHKLIYITAFLIFGHVVLQKINIWSLGMGVLLIAQIASHVYASKKRFG